ncbi:MULTISPECIES: DUF167 family protein [Aurantimonas]|uniref:DUF167 family protein n=1 Tax=Aurantimonas TaxID=182269 RepID=UPI00351841B3
MAEARFWRPDGEDAVLVDLRLTPKSVADRIEGSVTDAAGRAFLKARVRAVPEDGEANAALLKLLARTIGVPKSAVTLVAGHTSRLKTLRLTGDAGRLATALNALH